VKDKLKNIFLKIVQNRVFQHLVFWCLSVFVLVNLFRVSADLKMIDWIYTFVFHVVILLPVYLNLLILIPLLMAKNRYGLFFLGSVLNLALGVGFYYLVFNYLVDWILPGYYFVAVYDPFQIGLILLAYICLTFLIKLAGAWFLVSKIEKESTLHQLEALKSQVNPHFLFNTLSSIYSLTRKKSDLTPGVILQLSDIMRYMLYETNTEKVELIKELEIINNILEIHQVRFGEKLSVEKNIEGDIGEVKVAPLIFIPFVENALKHCRPTSEGNFFIRILFYNEGNTLGFTIENSFDETGSEVEEKSGIGLQNARKRLDLIYPGRHELKISRVKDIFKVQLKLKVN
jgi:two-component system, LytTR family, sensor kinase